MSRRSIVVGTGYGTGIRRRRRGKGFEYLDKDGRRIRELAIPPAWEEVWICPYPTGHIQATTAGASAVTRRSSSR